MNELKRTGNSFVYNKEQLEYIKTRMDIEVTKDEGWCIYIKKKKGK